MKIKQNNRFNSPLVFCRAPGVVFHTESSVQMESILHDHTVQQTSERWCPLQISYEDVFILDCHFMLLSLNNTQYREVWGLQYHAASNATLTVL